MTDGFRFPEFQTMTLDKLKVGIIQRVSMEMAYLASTVQLNAMVDDVLQHMIFKLRAYVLAEQRPPQQIHHTIRVQTTDPRHATWWDMFKATYQQRWWMRWRRWRIRYVQTPVTVERTVTVSVRDHWTYPRAAIALPPDKFGSPVMVSTWTADDYGTRW